MKRALVLYLVAWTLLGAGYDWGGPARKGVRELNEKRYDEALRDLSKGRADFPGAAVVPYDEGLAHLGRGAADSAAVRFREATRLRGDAPREAAAYNLGNLAMRAKDYTSAAASYREALRLRPQDLDAKKNLEEALRQMRQPRQPQQSRNQKNPPSGGSGPPPPGSADRPQPSPPQPQEPPPPRGTSGAFTKEEAERWLDALEAERRARRQEGKGRPTEEHGDRDW